MPFDPNLPANNAQILSAELRSQFTSLKALIDAQAIQITTLTTSLTTVQGQIATIMTQLTGLANVVPIGAVIAWFKDTPGVPAIPANFVECNGQVLSDAQSPLDGQLMPDINAERFVRGGAASGAVGGTALFATETGDNSGNGSPVSFVTMEPGSQQFPPYITAVFIMRVK